MMVSRVFCWKFLQQQQQQQREKTATGKNSNRKSTALSTRKKHYDRKSILATMRKYNRKSIITITNNGENTAAKAQQQLKN